MKRSNVVLTAAIATAALAMPPVASGATNAKTDTAATPAYVELNAANFQKEVDGKSVDLYTIRNKHGMVVKITNYGAKIEQILVPDRHGKLGDVAQGYETIDQVIGGQGSMGAFIGRYANRIAGGRFTMDGVNYTLAINDISTDPKNPRENTLHGGKRGSRFIPFDAKQLSPNSVQMSILFKDGEEGFPGDLPVRVVYTVTDNNELVITYDAVAVNKKTVANFTVHTFFNLSGDLGSSITDTIFTVNGTRVLEVTPALAPNGKIREVAGTPMDFREAKALGKDIGADYDLLKAGGGYDNHFIIDQKAPGAFTFDVRAYDPRSGRILEVWSTEPGIQLYSGNFLEGKVPRDVGKGNTVYKFRSGFCLEPSHFPDSLNHADFPSTTLNPGDWYSGKIVYRFSTDRAGMPVGKASPAKSDVKK
jgi:aldose 1-epimerase